MPRTLDRERIALSGKASAIRPERLAAPLHAGVGLRRCLLLRTVTRGDPDARWEVAP